MHMTAPEPLPPLDAQTRALIEQMKQGGFKPAHQIPLEVSRASLTQMAIVMAAPKVEVHSIEDRAIAGPGGSLPIRIYTPGPKVAEGTRAAAVFFHGGGMYLGDLETHDHVCRYLCKQANLVVVAVDYRLAPENKFPAAVEDCYTALLWTAGNAPELGVDPSRIALVGDSAGGTLVVSVCLLARQRGGPRVAYQVCVYPAMTMTDGEEFPSRRELGSGEYFISSEDFAFFRGLYLNDPDKEAHDPLASPIYADNYRGLPPALVISAGYDPCRDEDARYAERLKQDGVAVSYRCFTSTIHPFFLFDGVIDAGREGQQLVADTLSGFLKTK
jgi:acetyl esterase